MLIHVWKRAIRVVRIVAETVQVEATPLHRLVVVGVVVVLPATGKVLMPQRILL